MGQASHTQELQGKRDPWGAVLRVQRESTVLSETSSNHIPGPAGSSGLASNIAQDKKQQLRVGTATATPLPEDGHSEGSMKHIY